MAARQLDLEQPMGILPITGTGLLQGIARDDPRTISGLQSIYCLNNLFLMQKDHYCITTTNGRNLTNPSKRKQHASRTIHVNRKPMEKHVQKQLNSTLSYTRSFEQKHNVDAMIGGELYTYDEFAFEARTQNSPTDDIPTLNAGAGRIYTTSSKTAYRIMSGFGRVSYNYEMKYLLSLVARYDGISRLKDNRWGFFPGISAGWNIMEEDFWRESKLSNIITNFKPRISYGVNGNVNGIENFEVYGSYDQIDNSTYSGNSAFYNKLLVNTALRWEQSQSFEVGLDIGLLNNRVNFILDYYNRSTKDLLTQQALPGYTGFTEIMTNMGTLHNYGFEMEMRANILNNINGLNWSVTANLSSVANKITQLPYNGNEFNRVGGYQVWDEAKGELTWIGGRQEGGKLGDLVAYKQIRILKDWDDVRQYANNRIDNVASLYGPGLAAEYEGREGWQPIEPGDVLWEDRDGNNVIDGYDRRIIGNISPNITGGFSSTLSYKNLSLYARFDYAMGHTIYNDLAARSLWQYQGSFNIISEVKNTWSEDNPDSDLPKFYYADQLSKKNITRSNKFEGKRRYDLRLAGVEYVTKYSSANPNRLLWPINEATLTDNPALEQTPGY